MPYVTHVAIQVLLFIGLAYALDLVLGTTGILNICHAGFYGIGAYTAAILSLAYHSPLSLEIAVAAVTAASVAMLISLPSIRLHDDVFVLASFAFQVVISQVMLNWRSVTNGALGMSGIPAPILLRHSVQEKKVLFLLILAIIVCIVWTVRTLQRSPFGRVLYAIRSDETLAQALGKPTVKYKMDAFVISGVLASAAGVLYAHYMTFIDPSSFDANVSIMFVTLVIVGGAGSKWGPAFGALLVVLLPEALRFLPISSSVGPNLKQVIFSIGLVLILIFRPQGLAGKHEFGRIVDQ